MTDLLLHLCTPPEWRAALTSGVVAPPSLDDVGFVHLSTADQVELPANRLFAGRRDMLLLAVAADRLHSTGVEVRWEPGVPGDPESMRFPHAYGAVPAPAVRAVLPYLPDGEGSFAAPDVPELDDAGRARLFRSSVLHRTGTREVAGPDPDDQRADDRTARELVTMAAPVASLADGPVPASVAQVGLDDLRPLYDAGWTERVPGITDRHRLEDDVVDVRCLAAREDGEIVAACLVKLDGGTAWLDGLETAPASRRRGHAAGLVRAAVGLARESGADLLALDTWADDWTRAWYRRTGFREVGTTLHSVRA